MVKKRTAQEYSSVLNWQLSHYIKKYKKSGIIMHQPVGLRIRVMVFNATFNNISIISWRSDLLVEETGIPGENHRPVTSH